MKRKLLYAALTAIMISMIPAGALADQAMTPEALEVSNNLNCPVCEGQSVRDSNSQLARDMRRIVQELLDDGYTQDEVYDYFVDRYDEGILRDPPRSGIFLTLWWAPVIGIVIGALVLGTFLTQKRKPSSANADTATERSSDDTGEDDEDLSEYERRILRDLDDDDSYRGG